MDDTYFQGYVSYSMVDGVEKIENHSRRNDFIETI